MKIIKEGPVKKVSKTDKSKLIEMIRNEIYSQINESSNNVRNAVETATELDAQEMEEFFKELSRYFMNNRSTLTNFNAVGIAADLVNAYKKMKNRTGN